MAKDFDKRDLEALAKKFKVSPETCEQYHQFYDKTILPRVQKSYLAPLVSVVEDLINEHIRNGIMNDKPEKEAKIPLLRRYSIVLSDKLPRKNAAYTMVFPQGAIITYDPANSEEEIRFSIARELGNLLIHHGILPQTSAENPADLFAHFTSSIRE